MVIVNQVAIYHFIHLFLSDIFTYCEIDITLSNYYTILMYELNLMPIYLHLLPDIFTITYAILSSSGLIL